MASEEINGLRFYNSGDFTITGVLSGDCGSAQVFLVEDETGEKYALKVLNRKAVSGSEDAQKLYKIVRKEAEELEGLKHGAFPRVYGTYSHKDERGLVEKGLVMEYIPGETLEDKIKNGVNVEESLRYFEKAVEALDYLHNANGLSKAHRDIKPENIIIDEEGRLRILDLGSVTDKVGTTFGTTLKTFQGTVKYAHTEQIIGDASAATDLYSLGLVLYELVCGEIKTSEIGKTHEAVDYDKFRSKIGNERAEIVTEVLRGMLELKYKSGTELMRDYRRERVVVQERSNNTWNIPDIEPRKFVNDILHSDENIGLMQSSLKEYLSRNERLIGEEEKQRIKKIIDRLEKKENPISMAIEQFRTFPKERIFGSSREDIWGLERLVFNENGNYEGKLKDDEDFRGLVEKAYEKGINVNDLEEFIIMVSRYNDEIFQMSPKRIKDIRRRVKDRLNLEEEVENSYNLDLSDPRNRALTSVLAEDHVIHAGIISRNTDGTGFKPLSPFGNEIDATLRSFLSVIPATLGFGYLFYAIAGGSFSGGMDVIAGVVGGSLAGVTFGPKIYDFISNKLTRNNFNGNFSLHYDPKEIIAAVSELIDHETNISTLKEKVEKKGREEGVGSPIKLIRDVTEDYRKALPQITEEPESINYDELIKKSSTRIIELEIQEKYKNEGSKRKKIIKNLANNKN